MSKTNTKKPVSERQQDKKQRRCLMCDCDFTSGWSGERICSGCKSTNAWRSGEAA